jgi:hypothetical protein
MLREKTKGYGQDIIADELTPAKRRELIKFFNKDYKKTPHKEITLAEIKELKKMLNDESTINK